MKACEAILVVAVATSAFGHAQDAALQSKIESMIHEPQVARAHWGIHVTKLDGTPVAAVNEGQLFLPASNNKMFTTATAMALLNPEKTTVLTHVTADGKISKGVLRGNLRLVGAGDANLSGRVMPYLPKSQRPKVTIPPDELQYIKALADQIKAAGIKKIDGDVVGDDTLFPWDPYPADWSIDDAMWYYGAPISAIMIADNAINVKIAPGLKEGDAGVVMLNPAMPYYTVVNDVKTVAKGAETHLDYQRAAWFEGGSRTLHLYGTMALGAAVQEEDIAIADPAEYAAMALKAALEERGISVSGKARAKHEVMPEFTFTKSATEPLANFDTQYASLSLPIECLVNSEIPAKCNMPTAIATHESAPLYDDIVWTNKVSQNQHAEMFLHLLALRYGKNGNTAQGVRVVRSFLTTKAGIDPDDFIFYDGSGLSGHDLVAPRATTQLLRYAVTQPWGAAWKKSLPVAGEDGSLVARFPNAPLKDHVFAKTGTLGEVHALSGYIECASGQTLVFSIMVNNHTPRNSSDLKVLDKIVGVIQATE